MLHEFIKTNRTVLIDQCRAMVASRSETKTTADGPTHGIPIFLDQLIETLTIEKASESVRGRAEQGHSVSELGH
jgi:hypothetical protein